jgi:glycine/sarcosine N-methyltransferase
MGRHYIFSMSLYAELSEVYDELFPQDHAATSFLLGLTKGKGLPHRVLDLGCATASQLLELASEGWEAKGLEPCREMVDKALAKAELAEVAIEVKEGGMLDAVRHYPPASFGLMLCLGNTLPHLDGEAELRRFLADAAGLLVRGGELVVQLLNYDLVTKALAGSGHGFPELRAGAKVFRRHYEAAGPGKLAFVTELVQEGKTALPSRTLLSPFKPAELAKALQEAGFAPPVMTAGWKTQAGAFSAERDPYLILTARRR